MNEPAVSGPNIHAHAATWHAKGSAAPGIVWRLDVTRTEGGPLAILATPAGRIEIPTELVPTFAEMIAAAAAWPPAEDRDVEDPADPREPLDLDAIRARAEVARGREGVGSSIPTDESHDATQRLARTDVPALLAEVERLRAEVEFESTSADHAHDHCMAWRARAEKAEAERDDVAHRLSVTLCDLTGGKMSKPTYPARTMIQAVEAEFAEDAQHLEAERDEARAERDAALAQPATDEGARP